MILGIDPGFNGALCLITNSGALNILDMPLKKCETLTSRDRNREIDGSRVAEWLASQICGPIELAVLEQVGAMPGNGVSSMFRFGEGYGLIQGILCTRHIRLIKPRPAVWKAQLGVTSDKGTSIEMAKRLSNVKFHNYFALKKNDGRAEAFLLAVFGAKSLGWNLDGILGEKRNDVSDIF